MVAFMPAENLVAVAEAPPTIDAALEAAVSVAMRLSFASRATSVMLMVPLLSRLEVPMLRSLL
jgi:Ca2+/H+ antiporter